MANSEPPYLPIGTDVSAKYRGAFCEAKVKKIVKSVKCRVFLKETQSSLLVSDEYITGPLKTGSVVEVKHPDTGRVMEAVIKQMSDSSMYTVVFDDADERTLRRTQLCLKGDKHFMESETLDNLPLSNPEHFGTPVMGKGKRGRQSLGTPTSNHDDSEESSDGEGTPGRKVYKGKSQDLVGKVMFYDNGDRKKSQLFPVLVVLPDAHATELKNKDHVLVRSFKDGKFLSVSKKDLVVFSREAVLKNDDKTLKPAFEKTLLFIDNRELPTSWNKVELLGSDDEDDEAEGDSSDDDEPTEEKDRFVAQLYKFCDDRGTPMNKGPSIGSKDLNLHKLFKIVQNIGGYNRVTNQMKWRLVYSKMSLPPSNTASTQIKNAYKKYLHAFEDFYRKLGSSMGTVSRPGRNRNESGRNILNFRAKDSANSSPAHSKICRPIHHSPPNLMVRKANMELDCVGQAGSDKGPDDSRSEFDSDAEPAPGTPKPGTPVGTPKRNKSARMKLDMKDPKEDKKEEKKDEKKAEIKEKQETKKEEKKEVKKEVKKVEETPKRVVAKKAEEKKESKPEVEKKVVKKKEETAVKSKQEIDEEKELRELQKKISRRRSVRTDEKAQELEEAEKEKKEEMKDKKKEEKKEEKNEEKGEVKTEVEEKVDIEDKTEKKTKSKKSPPKEESEEEENESDEEDSTPLPTPAANVGDLPAGSRLRVRYGRGKNSSEYEAKILEVGTGAGPRQYLVHYQGWNTRHDEWIKQERIVRVIESKKKTHKGSPKPTPGIKLMKKTNLDKSPASPSSVKSDVSCTPISTGPGRPSSVKSDTSSTPVSTGPGRPSSVKSDSSTAISTGPGRPFKVKSTTTTTTSSPATPTSTPVTSSAKPRPTRSNSVEVKVLEGLPVRRRVRKTSGMVDSVHDSDNDASDKSDEETEVEKKPEKEKSEESSPTKSSSMPYIVNKKPLDDECELDENNIDRSPPLLSKVTDISKEKIDLEEKTADSLEKSEIKDEPVAPVLKVIDIEKNSEPILQKFEAQLHAVSPVKVVALPEVKVKDIKKKEPEKRGRKPVLKMAAEVVKAVVVELPKKEVEKVQEEVNVNCEKEDKLTEKNRNDSTYDFKDEPELETEIKVREKRKPVVLVQETKPVEKEQVKDSEPVKEEVSVVKNVSKDELDKEMPLRLSLFDDKDAAKSDSEVERRGRKKKLTVKEDVRIVKKAKLNLAEKKLLQITNSFEKKVVSVSPERKLFVTLAEKKQGFSPMVTVRKVPSVQVERSAETESAKVEIPSPEPVEKEKSESKEEVKKMTEMVVIHKESPVKNDIVLGRKVDLIDEDLEASDKKEKADDGDAVNKEDNHEIVNEVLSVKKKIRKKTKKKLEMDELESMSIFKKVTKTRGPGPRLKESVKRGNKEVSVKEKEKENEDTSAVTDIVNIDLHCEERIRSRSASPEAVSVSMKSISHQEAEGGFGSLLEAMECLKESQQGTSGFASKDDRLSVKNIVFENTPPTTPEHDSDESAGHNNSHNDQIKNIGGANMDASQAIGSESPGGNASPSNRSTGSSSGMVGGSEGSVDVPVHTTKRRRESDESTPSKRRKRTSRGKSSSHRAKHVAESDSEEASNMSSKCSPHYNSDSYPSKSPRNRSPRPSKYNFNLDEGKYLEGNRRILFLVDKIQEIRKIYMNLKSEVACIDRRRKRMRRREKESSNSSAVEVECS